MATWTLSDIILKVRNITSTPAQEQLTDAQITDYINKYYQFTMPFELKEQINLQPYDFQVFPNQNVYPALGTFYTDQPYAYADGFPLIFYQDRDVFFQDWPQQYSQDIVGVGDNSNPTFSGGTQNYPIQTGTYFITDGVQVVSDVPNSPFDGSGTFTGDGTGTINYITGAFSVTFNTAPSAAASIYDKYQAYEPARPQGVLFYNNQFQFAPIPDQVYQITMQGYISQVGLTAGATPLQSEWGYLIAYGASLDILADRGDLVAYNNNVPLLKRYENVALGRTVQQFESQQSIPRF